MSGRLASIAKPVVAPLVLVAIWEVLSRSGRVSATILPAPSSVAVCFWHYLVPLRPYEPSQGSRLAWLVSGELPQDAAGSLYRVLVGFSIGAGLALPLGLLMGAKESINEILNPLLQVLRPIPPIAFIPLAILWFGLGNPPAFFLISLGAFFPVLINTVAGVRNVDGIYLRAARNLGARGGTLFWRVILPAATPQILTGARVGVGVAFIVVIVAEMTAVDRGLGYRILEAREYFWSDKIIAGMVSIGLAGLGIDAGMSRLNRWLLRWHRGMEN